jgi:DNA-binding HxlR family transcriptional regulator
VSDSRLLETTPPWNVLDSHCPTRQARDFIADKWTALIIRCLSDGILRFAQLRRSVNGISQKVLTNILRGLERDGIVKRRIYASVPLKVEYSLTSLGRSFGGLVQGICDWSGANIEQVQAAREVYETEVAVGIPRMRAIQGRNDHLLATLSSRANWNCSCKFVSRKPSSFPGIQCNDSGVSG